MNFSIAFLWAFGKLRLLSWSSLECFLFECWNVTEDSDVTVAGPPGDTGTGPALDLLWCLSDWYKLYTIQKISSLTRIWNGWGPHDNEAITVMWPTPRGHLLVSSPPPCSRFDHTEKLVSVLLPFSGSLSSKSRFMLHCLCSHPFLVGLCSYAIFDGLYQLSSSDTASSFSMSAQRWTQAMAISTHSTS